MSPDDYAKRIEEIVINYSSKFIDQVKSSETAILGKINGYVRKLELRTDGTIKTNTANIKVLRSMKADINNVVVSDAYRRKLESYIKGFDDLKDNSDKYFTQFTLFAPNKNLYKQILNDSIEITKNSLLNAGISANVTEPIESILMQNISSGALIGDLEDELRLYIKGDTKRLGSLERYVTQITRDALNQYSANYTSAISSDLGLDWYYYTGGTKTNTRSYCQTRAGKYFKKSEVQNVPESWSGRIPGTNSSNILIYRGGYNCMHQYIPVMEESVPKQYRNG